MFNLTIGFSTKSIEIIIRENVFKQQEKKPRVNVKYNRSALKITHYFLIVEDICSRYSGIHFKVVQELVLFTDFSNYKGGWSIASSFKGLRTYIFETSYNHMLWKFLVRNCLYVTSRGLRLGSKECSEHMNDWQYLSPGDLEQNEFFLKSKPWEFFVPWRLIMVTWNVTWLKI